MGGAVAGGVKKLVKIFQCDRSTIKIERFLLRSEKNCVWLLVKFGVKKTTLVA